MPPPSLFKLLCSPCCACTERILLPARAIFLPLQHWTTSSSRDMPWIFEAQRGNPCNFLRKSYLLDELLDSFQAWSLGNWRPLWNFFMCGLNNRFHSVGNVRGTSSRRDRRSANYFFLGQRGVVRVMVRFPGPVLEEWMGGRHRHLDCPYCVGKRLFFPCNRIWNGRHVQRQLCPKCHIPFHNIHVSPSGKEIFVGTTKLLADGIEHLRKKWPLGWKNLIWTTNRAW